MTDEEMQAAIEEAVAKATTAMEEQHKADIAGLKKKNSELIADKKKLTDAADDLAEKKAEADGDIEALKANHQKALDKLMKERDEANAHRDTLLIDNKISAEFSKLNIMPHFQGTLMKALKVDAKVENGEGVIDGVPISDYMKSYFGTDEGKHYVSAPDTSGAGAVSSSNVNTSTSKFTKENFDTAEWLLLAKNDPTQAKAVAQECGRSDLAGSLD